MSITAVSVMRSFQGLNKRCLMLRYLGLLLTLLYAGCVALPAPQPQFSPLIVKEVTSCVYLPVVLPTDPWAPKLGVAGGDAAMLRVLGGGWAYNWSTHGQSEPGYEFVPMVWGKFTDVPDLPDGTQHALLFNEPDREDQANLEPGYAAALAYQVLGSYPWIAWGAPAIGRNGGAWLDQWFAAYRCLYGVYPPVKFLTMHCYLGTAAACIRLAEDYFRPRLQQYGVTELWVTEFGFHANWPNAAQEAATFVNWMETQDWIARYAVYVSYAEGGDAPFSIFERDHCTLTPVGRWYSRVPGPP